MAKAEKDKTTGKRGSYEKPLVVKGTFAEVMKAAVEDAKKKSAPKKKP